MKRQLTQCHWGPTGSAPGGRGHSGDMFCRWLGAIEGQSIVEGCMKLRTKAEGMFGRLAECRVWGGGWGGPLAASLGSTLHGPGKQAEVARKMHMRRMRWQKGKKKRKIPFL